MAIPASAPSATTPESDGNVELRSLDWWAGLEFDAYSSGAERRVPPIPTFVRLSRLIDPAGVEAARSSLSPGVSVNTSEAYPSPAALIGEGDPKSILSTESTPLATVDQAPVENQARGWAQSAGRPLFQIGLAALTAATVIGVSTFGAPADDLSTVESPSKPASIDPGVGAVTDDDRARDVLAALVRQTGDSEADVSLVGTATGHGPEVRWMATVRNEGPETAQGPITVVHTIGSEFELMSGAGMGWDCLHQRTSGTVVCELDEHLAVGQRRRLGLVTANRDTQPGARIPSTMSVVTMTADPNLDNNTINVTAVAGPAVDSDNTRSRSTGAAGQDSESNSAATSDQNEGDSADTAATDEGDDDATNAAVNSMEELPRTGSGLALALGGLGVALCASGRRLMTWSNRAQTRSLLAAANIE